MKHTVTALNPEEEAIGDLTDDDDIDTTLPADLWFRVPVGHRATARKCQPTTLSTSSTAQSKTQ